MSRTFTPVEDHLLNKIGYRLYKDVPFQGLPLMSEPSRKRTPIEYDYQWTEYEGVHLNPKDRGIDVVRVMDFDMYNKDGTPKTKNPQTIHQILDRMRAENVPLPYCLVPSGTSGNWHMIWTLEMPVERGTMYSDRDIDSHWGADRRFSNSLSRNPFYWSAHPHPDGRKTIWWPEYSDVQPEELISEDQLRGNMADSYAFTEEMKRPKKGGSPAPTRKQTRSSNEDYIHRPMTLSQLVKLMKGAVDGESRFQKLSRWMNIHVSRRVREAKTFLSPEEISELLQQGNALFAEPLEPHRLKYIQEYWTPERQVGLSQRQIIAGNNNLLSKQASVTANLQWQACRNIEDNLMKKKLGEDYHLTPEQEQRSNEFLARADIRIKFMHCKPTREYTAYVFGKFSEHIDTETGEVTLTGDKAWLKNLFDAGIKAKYIDGEVHQKSAELDKALKLKYGSGVHVRTNVDEYLANPYPFEKDTYQDQPPIEEMWGVTPPSENGESPDRVSPSGYEVALSFGAVKDRISAVAHVDAQYTSPRTILSQQNNNQLRTNVITVTTPLLKKEQKRAKIFNC